jgi:uncharacterized protein (DUF4415 family)
MNKQSNTDWKQLASMDDEKIDTRDIPELDKNFFANAEICVPTKQPVTMRLDADVLEWFKSEGQGYQTRINQLLRKYMENQLRYGAKESFAVREEDRQWVDSKPVGKEL